MYKVDEIFYSIQGEGRWAGTAMIFVRLYGCNLSCEWCDTPQENFNEMSMDAILSKIEDINYEYGNNINRVCFTGGEPLLQLDQYLFDLLANKGYNIHVETNGTIIPEGWAYALLNFGWITVSPKSCDTSWKLRNGSELKVVYTGQDLYPYFDERYNFKQKMVYLQPCTIMKPLTVAPGFCRESNINEVVKLVKMYPTVTRLSLQMHKLIGIK